MITMMEFAKRRKELMKKIDPRGIVILFSAPACVRNNDCDYVYRQNSDFYYLTGFAEPESIAILAPKRKAGEFILFNRVRDREHEIWEGKRAGQEGARKDYHADQAFAIHEFAAMLPELIEGREHVYYPLGKDKAADHCITTAIEKIRSKIRNGVRAPISLVDVSDILHEMRLFKSPAEINLMRKAAEISAKAHIRAMQACRPGIYEYELEAELLYEFQRQGARNPAYTCIVGNGANSCILHYNTNREKISDGNIVLIDAGAEYEYYAADITRTFPANGRFSPEQKAVYEIVLDAQVAGIKAIRPGVAFPAIQKIMVKIITQGLVDIGILNGNVSDLIEKEAYFDYYMHKSGHWLGLDVHDAGRYKIGDKWRTLEPGMVLTVEPGIYISADIKGVPKRWQHIGVRIEDDILVTEKGHEVLSAAAPKTVAEIEDLMRAK